MPVDVAKPKPIAVLIIRFPPLYAWIVIGVGAVFLLLSLVFAALGSAHNNLGFDAFLAIVSVAAIVGGNYWRHHLHVVARLTPEHLFLRREGAIDWADIATIEKGTLRLSRRQTQAESEFACITLKHPRAPRSGLEATLSRLKSAVTGYDIIVPGNELSCTVDFFVAECKKRMAPAGRE
jgi:hypothetical protein